MATVSKIPDLDSGVASPEVILTPEGIVSENKNISMGTSSAAAEKITMANSTEEKQSESNLKISKNENSILAHAILRDDGIDSDDDDDNEVLEESLSERLVGLTEMFPESVRTAASVFTCKTKSFFKNAYNLSRQVVWIGVSSSILLIAPVMFEIERFNVEEMLKQDRNRLVLGPGSAMSGPPAPPGLTR